MVVVLVGPMIVGVGSALLDPLSQSQWVASEEDRELRERQHPQCPPTAQ